MPAITLPVGAGRDDGWLTRREAAVLAGCSEDTIKRDVNAHGLTTRTADNGAVLLLADDLVRIGRLRADTVSAAGNTAQVLAELRQVQDALAAAREQLAGATGRLEERTGIIEQLKSQLTAKDRQLEALTRSVRDLTSAVAGRHGGDL